MGIPLAALQARAPQMEGPLESLGRISSLKGVMQRQQYNELLLEEERRAAEERKLQRERKKKINAIISEHEGDLRKAVPEIMKIDPEMALGYQELLSKAEKAEIDKLISFTDLGSKRAKRASSIVAAAKKQGTVEAQQNAVIQLYQEQVLDNFDENTARQLLQKISQNPFDEETLDFVISDFETLGKMMDFENKRAKEERDKRKDELKEPGVKADLLSKHLKNISRVMGAAKNKRDWEHKRNVFLPAQGIPKEVIDANVPPEYSAASVEAVRRLEAGPPAPEKPEKPSAKEEIKSRVEAAAREALKLANNDFDKAIEIVNSDPSVPDQHRAAVRNRIREMARPGTAPLDRIEQLRKDLGLNP